MNPKDLFSENAADYSVFRPDYPQELYDFIFSHVSNFDLAWDCGTGNGQAAKVLANRFKKVYATDISNKQLTNAIQRENIFYSVSSAEKNSFSDKQFGLITVAQAIHWFKFDEFYSEVNRVALPNAVLAVWGYGLMSVNKEFDYALSQFYKNVVGPYWDAERRYIDEQYSTIPFPFNEIAIPEFHFTKKWSFMQLAGYLNTWSAVRKFIKINSYSPVEEFILSAKTKLSDEVIEIRFPLFARVGMVLNP